jgi:hypothetical protein
VRLVATIALAVVAAPPPAQMPSPTPPPLVRPRSEARPSSLEGQYGSPETVELDRVAHNGTSYHRRHVRVRGILGELASGQYLSLTDERVVVMLIPLDPSYVQDFMTMSGLDVDVTGIARVLPARHVLVPCRGERMPESLCDDPDLPLPPVAQPNWPSVSITVFKIVDRGTSGGRRGAGDAAGASIEGAAAGSGPVTAVGQFRGANLCRDLPEATRRDTRDWVLLTPEGPVWVTGRAPQGRGFRLDPADRGDAKRWLAVAGRVTTVDGVRLLRATSVSLAARPPDSEPAPCAP